MAFFITAEATKLSQQTLNVEFKISENLTKTQTESFSWGYGYDDRAKMRSFWKSWYNKKPQYPGSDAGRVVPGKYNSFSTFEAEILDYLTSLSIAGVDVESLNDKLDTLLLPEEDDFKIVDDIASNASAAMTAEVQKNNATYEELKQQAIEDAKKHTLGGQGIKAAPVDSQPDPIGTTNKPVNSKSAPVVNLNKLSAMDRVKLEQIKDDEKALDDVSGIGGKRLWEPVPQNKKYDADVLYEGFNNSGVLFSRDESYVLRGHTRAGSTYLYAGRSPHEIETESQATFENEALPGDRIGLVKRTDLISDSAYLYLSQKADSDALLQIPVGTYGAAVNKPRTGESLAALKADGVAIMARKSGIRLVAPSGDKKDSKGGLIEGKFGIDLISGNGDLEPLVLGDSLHVYLEGLSKAIDGVAAQLYNFLMSQIQFNAALCGHRHGDPFSIMVGTMGASNPTAVLGGKDLPDIEMMLNGFKALGEQLAIQASCVAVMKNQVANDLNGLQPPGGYYFLSSRNRAN